EREHRRVVGRIERDASRKLSNARLPWGSIELGQRRAGAQGPGQRMLAPAAADQKNVHDVKALAVLDCFSSPVYHLPLCKQARTDSLASPPSPVPNSGGNVAEYTVSELSNAVKRTLED